MVKQIFILKSVWPQSYSYREYLFIYLFLLVFFSLKKTSSALEYLCHSTSSGGLFLQFGRTPCLDLTNDGALWPDGAASSTTILYVCVCLGGGERSSGNKKEEEGSRSRERCLLCRLPSEEVVGRGWGRWEWDRVLWGHCSWREKEEERRWKRS